jgi:hypothetical protein
MKRERDKQTTPCHFRAKLKKLKKFELSIETKLQQLQRKAKYCDNYYNSYNSCGKLKEIYTISGNGTITVAMEGYPLQRL